MDLDLITALIAPKTNLAELPTLESIDAPEVDTEAFTAFMQAPPATQDPDLPATQNPDLPTLEWPLQMPMATPQEESAAPNAKKETPEGDIADAPPEIKGFAALPAELKTIIPRPDATPPKVEASLSATTQATGTIQHPSIEGSAIPQVQAAVQAPTRTDPVAPSIAPSTEILAPITPDVKQPITAPLSPNTPTQVIPAKLASRPVVEVQPTRTEPTIRAASLPATRTTPKAPALPVQFANLERVIDDPAEVQFSIKIERQSIEHVQAFRAPSAPAPVANQISTQLPPLLTKAEKQTVELRLDPPELGRVTIHLSTHDQQVTAQVVAERVQTVDLMRQHADLLTATLARAGFSEANLSFQQGQGGEKGSEQFQAFAGASESDTSTAPAPTLTGQDGRLDIRL